MGRRRTNGIEDLGEFFKLTDGRSIFKCRACKQQLEFGNLSLFVMHLKDKHSLPNLTKTKQQISQNENKDDSIQQNLKPIPKIKIKLKTSQDEKIQNKNYEILNESYGIVERSNDKMLQNQDFNCKNTLDDIVFKKFEINVKELDNDHEISFNYCDFKNNNCNLDENIENYEEESHVPTKINSEIAVDAVVNSEIVANQNLPDYSEVGLFSGENSTEVKYELVNNLGVSLAKVSSTESLNEKDNKYLQEDSNDDNHNSDVSEDYLQKQRDFKCTYKCKTCGIVYKKESTLVRHIESCKRSNKREKFKRSQHSVMFKINNENENGMYQCSNCELEFSSLNDFKSHEKFHTLEINKPKPQCEICGKYLKSIKSLKLHLLKHSGRSPYKCLKCNRGFYNKYTLASHEQIHNPGKVYKCKYCDKEYARNVDLKRHLRYAHLEHKSNPVMCDLCGKSFSFAFNLKYHMRRHLNVKPIKCDKCDMTFVEKGDLNKHLITHNPEYKPFVCEICSKSFSRKITLTKHQKLHTGLKEYVCKICGKAFAQSPGLYMHMKTHGFNIKPEGAGYYERQSHLLFRNMNSDRANLN